MKIAVLVSVGRHPVSGTARYSRNDAAALTIALSLAKAHSATLDVLHAGDPSNPALQDYLALGARTVEVLEVPATSDREADAAAPLAARLRGYDLVLTGTRAEGAFDSGMLPYRVATALRSAASRRGCRSDDTRRLRAKSANSCRRVCADASKCACPR